MKVILFGFGKAGQDLMRELIQNPHVSEIDIFDPQIPERQNYNFPNKTIRYLSKFAPREFNYDLTVIASPDDTHAQYILTSLQNHISCFVEKPIVTNCEDLEAVTQMLQLRPKLLLTTNFILRAAPLFVRLKDLISTKYFGSKIYIEGKYLYGRWEKIANGWRGNPDHDYSVILGGLIHLVDLSCYLTGNYDFKVKHERIRLTERLPEHLYDFGDVKLYSDSIGICNLSTTFSSPVSHRRDISIYGDLGWVEIVGESVRTGGSLAGMGLEGLRTVSESKGLLLKEFIDLIQDRPMPLRKGPTNAEVLKVHQLLMDG